MEHIEEDVARQYVEKRRDAIRGQLVREAATYLDELTDLRGKYNALKTAAERIVAPRIVIEEQQQDNSGASGNDDNPFRPEKTTGNHGRQHLIDTLTEPELLAAAQRMAFDRTQENSQLYLRLENMRDRPSTLAETTPHQNELVQLRRQLLQPALDYYSKIVVQIAQAVRIAQHPLPAGGAAQIGALAEVRPSGWFENLMAVYDRASTIGPVEEYPRAANFDGILFKKIRARRFPVNRQTGAMSTTAEDIETTFVSYAVDLGYQLCMFASLFGTTHLVPVEERIPERLITDFELFMDFAVYHYVETTDLVGNDDEFSHIGFLRRPFAYWTDPESRKHLANAAVKALDLLVSSFNQRFVFGSHNGQPTLLRFVAAEKESLQQRQRQVPDNVMVVLRAFVDDNAKLYNQANAIATYVGQRAHLLGKSSALYYVPEQDSPLLRSPIGLFLNQHKPSVNDFKRLYSTLESSGVDRYTVRMSLVPEVGSLPCVMRIYQQLMLACVSFSAARTTKQVGGLLMADELDPNMLFTRCVDVTENDGVVSYCSTLEAVPGLPLHNLLFVDDDQGPNNSAAPSPMGDPEYFRLRPDRVNMFNLMAAYFRSVPSIEEAKLTRELPGLAGLLTKPNSDAAAHLTPFFFEGAEMARGDDLHGIRWMERLAVVRVTSAVDINVVLASHINHYFSSSRQVGAFYESKLKNELYSSRSRDVNPIETLDETETIRRAYLDRSGGWLAFFRQPVLFDVGTSVIDTSSTARTARRFEFNVGGAFPSAGGIQQQQRPYPGAGGWGVGSFGPTLFPIGVVENLPVPGMAISSSSRTTS